MDIKKLNEELESILHENNFEERYNEIKPEEIEFRIIELLKNNGITNEWIKDKVEFYDDFDVYSKADNAKHVAESMLNGVNMNDLIEYLYGYYDGYSKIVEQNIINFFARVISRIYSDKISLN